MINSEDFQQFEAIFHPRSIAVVGASEDHVRPGGAFFQNLVTAGFKGGLYPVNLKGGKIGEYDVYRHLTDIPHPVDLVIVSIPRDGVLHVLEECAANQRVIDMTRCAVDAVGARCVRLDTPARVSPRLRKQ